MDDLGVPLFSETSISHPKAVGKMSFLSQWSFFLEGTQGWCEWWWKHDFFHIWLIWKDHGYQLALQESLPGPTKGTGSSQINLEPNSGLESRVLFFVEAKSAVRDLEFQGRKMDPISSLTFLVLLTSAVGDNYSNHIIHKGRSLYKIEKKEMESQTEICPQIYRYKSAKRRADFCFVPSNLCFIYFVDTFGLVTHHHWQVCGVLDRRINMNGFWWLIRWAPLGGNR